MEEKLNGLCVRVVDYKDNDRLITLCTAEKGKILVKATGCKKPKAKLKYATSPLCFGEYSVIENKGRYTLKGCEVYDSFNDLVLDLKRYYAGFSILEWLDKLTVSNEIETCRVLLIRGTRALKSLCYEDELSEKILINFVYDTLDILGYGLNLDTCAATGKSLKNQRLCFDYYSGAIVSYDNRSMDYVELSENDVSALKNDAELSQREYINLLENLEHILCFFTGIKKNYSLGEFLKY